MRGACRAGAAVLLAMASVATASAQTLTQEPPAGAAAPVAPAPASPFVPLAATDILASNVVDLELTGPGGERLGEIVDVVLAPGAQGAYAIVVAVAGTLGVRERFAALSASSVAFTREGESKWKATARVTLRELQDAPAVTYRSGWNQ